MDDYADQRYYGVGTGRFGTPDPSTGVSLGNPASWNKYAYVQGDPVNYYDPEGLQIRGPWYCSPEYTYAECYGYDGTITIGGGGGGGGSTQDGTPAVCGDGISPSQCDALLGYYRFYLLAPTPSALDALLSAVGKITSGVAGAIIVAIFNPTPMGNGSFPSVEWVEANCKKVGEPVIVPSTNYPGGRSVEQEYECPDGMHYTTHSLFTKSGIPKEKHLRPGRPKYGPKKGRLGYEGADGGGD